MIPQAALALLSTAATMPVFADIDSAIAMPAMDGRAHIWGAPTVYSLSQTQLNVMDSSLVAANPVLCTAGTVALVGSFVDSFAATPAYQLEAVRQLAVISDSVGGWKKSLLDPGATTDVDSISETIDSVFAALTTFGPGAVDLSGVAIHTVNGEHLAAILRVTSSLQEFTPGWEHALEVAKAALTNAGADPADALFGMV